MADSFDELLREGGWAPGRAVSTEVARQKATDEGFSWWPEVQAVLAEFTGVEVHYQDPTDRDDYVRIDPIQGMDWLDAEEVAEHREVLGTDLLPVGVAGHQHVTLMAGRDGRYYGAVDSYLSFYGTSPREMIQRAVENTAEAIPE